MTRYFYIDPPAAAWMAKHFGMRFLYTCGDEQPPHPKFFPHDLPALVHPDSLPLLEPREGDVGTVFNGHAANFHTISGDTGWWWGDDQVEPPDGGCIIQRDGKPFFWPERQA